MANGNRDKLREQQALADDIAAVITAPPLGDAIDEADLEDELANLEQETIDERMLKTGTVPVADQLNRLPVAGNGERTSPLLSHLHIYAAARLTMAVIKGKAKQTEEEEDEEAELEKLRAEMAMS